MSRVYNRVYQWYNLAVRGQRKVMSDLFWGNVDHVIVLIVGFLLGMWAESAARRRYEENTDEDDPAS